MSDANNLFEQALEEAQQDKDQHIPYLIYNHETLAGNSDSIAQEILHHSEIQKFLTLLATPNPDSITTDSFLKLIGPNLEITLKPIVPILNSFYLDHPQTTGYEMETDLFPFNKKVKFHRNIDEGSPITMHVTTTTECTSPENGTISRTEIYNLKGEKISDIYRLESPKISFDRTESIDVFTSNIFLEVWSTMNNNVLNYKNPKGYYIEIGFTSFQNGDAPIMVFMSEDQNQNHLVLRDQADITRQDTELRKYYTLIAQQYGSQILEQDLSISS